MKNRTEFFAIITVVLLLFSIAACDNGTTSNTDGMEEILRVDKEVRDLFFYASNGINPDSSEDAGTYPGVCSDYAMEFYYRYSGEVYIVAVSYGGTTTWSTVEFLPASTFNFRTKENFSINTIYPSSTVGEYDGVLRDARLTVVSNERWTEQSHANAVFHMWCAAVADGKWYLVDPTWRDNDLANNPIRQITPPSFAR